MDAAAAEAEARTAGGAAIGRARHAHRKFWALLLTHTLLTGACIACCVFTLQRPAVPPPPPVSVDRGIYLNMMDAKNNNGPTLNFSKPTWNESVELHHGSELMVKYPGPYILYICVSLFGESNDQWANLTLQQGERKISIKLQAEVKTSNLCVRHERLISLYEQEVVTFSLYQQEKDSLTLSDLRIGLHYMLGKQHFETPGPLEGQN